MAIGAEGRARKQAGYGCPNRRMSRPRSADSKSGAGWRGVSQASKSGQDALDRASYAMGKP